MTERPIERVPVAIGHELDALAEYYGVPFRRTGESDDTLRKRIQAEINRDQSEGPSPRERGYAEGWYSEGPSERERGYTEGWYDMMAKAADIAAAMGREDIELKIRAVKRRPRR